MGALMIETAVSQLMSFLDTLPEPRIMMNRDYTIVGANRAYLEHYRVEDQPVDGRKCHEVSHGFRRPCDEEGESCPLKTSLQTCQPQRVLHIHHMGHESARSRRCSHLHYRFGASVKATSACSR